VGHLAVLAVCDHVLRVAESPSQPVDGGTRVAIAETRKDVLHQFLLLGFLETVGGERTDVL
jgi:hypothetical protein